MTNPNGLRQEGLFQNISEEQWDWEGIWYTASTIDERGWITEIAIPFKTLSFDPEQRHLGHQLPPRDRAARRAHGLGLAQSQLRSQHVGHGRRPHGTRAGRRSRHRAVAVRQRAPAVRRHGIDDRHRSVARRVLQDHAEPHGRADDQHGFLGHRGRRSAGQPDALRPVLSREARLLPPGRRHLRVRRVGSRTAGRSSRGASA